MKHHFITNIESWVNGKQKGWWNSYMTLDGEMDAIALYEAIIDGAAKELHCHKAHVRIVGIFSLGTSESDQ